MSPGAVTAVSEFLETEIARGSFPGAAALIAGPEGILEETRAGQAVVEPSTVVVSQPTLWDLASLTKPLCCGSLTRIAAGGGLDLDLAPGHFFPAWKSTRYAGITLRSLLSHTSGIPAWFPLYARGEGARAYAKTLAEIEPSAAPGSAVLYSDLNFLLLGDILETYFSAPLDRAFSKLVAGPAGSAACFLPGDARNTAATEKGDETERRMTLDLGLSYSGFRSGVAWGEVHDGNALRRGGVAGNAGLFGTPRDVWALARGWLVDCPPEFCGDATAPHSEGRGLSWQSRRGAGSAIPEMSPRSFGHTGFTGTSLWIAPDAGRVAILLTNRIHPSVRPGDFNEVRQRFHRLAWGLTA
jgi:CubicO group peptidase (beta-lactamase class C family)